jgi:hypothetical protein
VRSFKDVIRGLTPGTERSIFSLENQRVRNESTNLRYKEHFGDVLMAGGNLIDQSAYQVFHAQRLAIPEERGMTSRQPYLSIVAEP